MFNIKSFYFRYIKTFLYALVSLALIVMIIILSVVNFKPDNNEVSKTTPTIEPDVATNKLKIQLAGDVILNNYLLQSNLNNNEYNFDEVFSQIKNKIDGDVCLFNLEGVIDAYNDGSQIAGAPIFNYPKEISSAMKNVGFNVCNTANDRVASFSNTGIINNYNNLKNNGLVPVGTSVEGGNNYIVAQINGINIAILAYTDMLSDFNNVDTNRISCIDFNDVEGTVDIISKDVQAVRKLGAEIIIASIHWGDEISLQPTEEQRDLADKIVKCGVDIIYGTGAHIFQTVTYKNIVDNEDNNKNVVVAYSMGNFLLHPNVTSGQASQQSAMLNIYIERDQTHKAYISTAECVPIYIYAGLINEKEHIYKYRVLSAMDYVEAQTRPEVFLNDQDWQECKDAYKYVKETVEKSGKNGMSLGLK